MSRQSTTWQTSLQQAISQHRQGNLPLAEAAYARVLQLRPNQPDALHMLGILQFQSGRRDEAIELLRAATELSPEKSAFHTDLAMALLAHDRLQDAVDAYRRALELNPNQAEAWSNLGNALFRLDKLDEAIVACRRAIALRPQFPQAFFNLGMVLGKQRQLEEAASAFRQSISFRPNYAEALNGLGAVLAEAGKSDEAISVFHQAIALRSDYRDAWNNLGNSLREQDRGEEALSAFEQVLSRNPKDAEVLNNLGTTLESLSRYDEAIQAYRRTLAIRPDFAEAFYNLGNAFQRQGKLDEAIESYRSAIAIQSDLQAAHHNLANALREAGELDSAFSGYHRALEIGPNSHLFGTLLYSLHLDPDVSRHDLFEEHQCWNRTYAQPLAHLIQPHTNDRSPERRLRIGYVSPDFGNHSVGRFMVPLLAHHSHGSYEIFCYTDTLKMDFISEQNRASASAWRLTARMTDQQVAELIRNDQIDVLVDLTMHASQNRLLVFARKPAPVQVTYLAYAGTTGLEVMDYRLSDPYLDPQVGGGPSSAHVPQGPNEFYSEKTYCLPRTFWCYGAPPEAPEPSEPPVVKSGEIIFGCLNSFGKVTKAILPAWFRILSDVPNSQLILHSREGAHRTRLCDECERHGVARSRIEFVGFVGTRSYLGTYNRIDIALDTFPYTGGTTSCDTLWMGVPLVSLFGESPHTRGGLSILSNIELAELATSDIDRYVEITKELAADVPRLAKLRGEMRDRMRASPLMNARQFARDIEDAYRQMWRTWCATGT